jgi:hypothetical protein
MAEVPPVPGSITLDVAALGQLAYHSRCAAALAAEGSGDAAAPHALLSFALLHSLGGAELERTMHALDLPDTVGDFKGPKGERVRATADELALQLVAHFTSEGRHDLAGLYTDACDLMRATAS